jgi:hypothetical protein
MDRRESLKTLLIGSLAGASMGAAACTPGETKESTTTPEPQTGLYGRQPHEIERDEKLMAEVFLNEHELETIAILCDIILPATNTAGSAVEAGVPEFIEFIVKDIPSHQLPLRGGLMWLDRESNLRYNKLFKDCSNEEQMVLVDDIAYPDPEGQKPELAYGIRFFERMRGLTVTGYYTSKMGIEDLGYQGNVPNVWDGVPEEVLAKHDVDYDPDWIAKCVDQSKRMEIAQWDDEGNLLT